MANRNETSKRISVMKLILTYDGQDITEIPHTTCETIVYHVQEEVDRQAREGGEKYGKIVSTRRLTCS